jgi:hypothetical protein
MSDQALDILKLALLAMLYLFFARVLWAVWSEVRTPAGPRQSHPFPPQPAAVTHPDSSTTLGRRATKPPKGRRGTPARLVVLEPKERRGTAFAIGAGGVSIGREPDNTITIGGDSFVSGHHAKISAVQSDQGVRVLVDDLDSKNGTYLNGVRLVAQSSLEVGDRIQIGYTVLEAQ